MLGFMRKKAGSWIIKIVLGAIVIVFIFWGVGSFSPNKKGQVALVNGEPITQEEYSRAYQNQIDYLKQRYQGELTPQMIEQLHIKRQVVEGLINQQLLLQAAKRLKLRVSDEEVSDAIRSIDLFKTAGSFDIRRYRAILDRLRLTSDAFKESERQSLLLGKLRSFLLDGIHVSDGEARQWYDFKNAMVSVDYVWFSPQNYTKIDPTDKELKAYYDAHSSAYKTQPEVKARYVAFRPVDYEKQVTVSDSDIAEYYDEHPDQFRTEKTVQARHILIKVAKNAPADKVAEARKKIEAILKKARSGKDFAELAKKYSEGPSRDKGGELGAFTKEQMVKPFADKAFSMKAGQISDPVRTQFGWHIIKVEKVNKASTRSLDQAREEIRAKLAKKMAQGMAEDAAEKAYDAAFSNGDLQKTARDQKLELKTTDFFNSKGSPLRIAGADKFAAAAFDLADKEVSAVVKCPDAYYILQRMETKPSVIPAFDAVKTAVRKDLILEKQKEKAKADAKAFLSAVKGGADLASEAKKYGLEVKNSGFFKRTEMNFQIGFSRAIVQSAFSLSAEKRFPDTISAGSKGDCVIAFKDRKAPDPKGFSKEKDKLVKTLRQEKEGEYYSKWIDRLRAKSDITVNEPYKNMD